MLERPIFLRFDIGLTRRFKLVLGGNMNPEISHKLEQFRREAQVEHLLRAINKSITWAELEQRTKRIFNLKFWGVQLEVRNLVRR